MFRIIVEGERACFTRPECKVERVSYSVPTPSAMEGLLKAVYWKPAIRYVIDKIVVFNPIDYACVRRNEREKKISLSTIKNQMSGKDVDPCLYIKDTISQRATLFLKDVKYGVEFHFEMTGIRSDHEDENEGKHASIIRRRLENGQCFKTPCLGCREFAARSVVLTDSFNLAEVDSSLSGEQDLGVMFYGLRFKDDERLKTDWSAKYFSDAADAVYYHPKMVNGVIDVAKYREAGL